MLAMLVTCIALGVPASAAAQSGQFTPTGSLAFARNSHTATQLPSGQVLIVGGGAGYVSTAELFDPMTGAFTTTGNLAVGRSNHTATLLPNGRVLVVGGMVAYGNSTASAELYDPATGTFVSTGNLNVARYNHTATRLPNGKVLIAGGRLNGGCLTESAELYDPSTGTFSTTDSLSVRRQNHTATPLPNGKVLVAGGVTGAQDAFSQEGWSATASAEIFDPETATFIGAPSMVAPRANHTATLLPNGKVLLVAGNQGDSVNGAQTASTELFDSSQGTFTVSGSLSNTRYAHAATLLPNGKVLVTGGRGAYQAFLTAAELYDTASGTVAQAGDMTVPRAFFTATLLAANGKVLLSGGGTAPAYDTATAELYGDPLLCQ